MPLLFYWHPDNYWRDLDAGVGFHLNQANPLMHEIGLGDSLWAFTRTDSGQYVLAAELVVKAKTLNPTGYRYGSYRVWGDLHRSRYFQVSGQPDMEQIIRSLSIRPKAAALGQSFQGRAAVRAMTREDHAILAAAAANLPAEPRARLLPEERLEAALLIGDEAGVRDLMREQRAGIAEERKAYLLSKAPARNRGLVVELREMYAGRCQICLWDPRTDYGPHLCHGHHIHWLSRGGADDLGNMVLLCPNHHAAVHGCDAPLDYLDLAFDFGSRRERLQANRHLRP